MNSPENCCESNLSDWGTLWLFTDLSKTQQGHICFEVETEEDSFFRCAGKQILECFIFF